MLIRVTVVNPWGSGEVRYLEHLPAVGSTMRSQATTWRVTDVERNESGGYRAAVVARVVTAHSEEES